MSSHCSVAGTSSCQAHSGSAQVGLADGPFIGGEVPPPAQWFSLPMGMAKKVGAGRLLILKRREVLYKQDLEMAHALETKFQFPRRGIHIRFRIEKEGRSRWQVHVHANASRRAPHCVVRWNVPLKIPLGLLLTPTSNFRAVVALLFGNWI